MLFSLAFLAASLSDFLISLKEMANPQWPFLFLKSSEAKIRVMQPFPKQYWSELQEKKSEVGRWIKPGQSEGWESREVHLIQFFLGPHFPLVMGCDTAGISPGIIPRLFLFYGRP